MASDLQNSKPVSLNSTLQKGYEVDKSKRIIVRVKEVRLLEGSPSFNLNIKGEPAVVTGNEFVLSSSPYRLMGNSAYCIDTNIVFKRKRIKSLFYPDPAFKKAFLGIESSVFYSTRGLLTFVVLCIRPRVDVVKSFPFARLVFPEIDTSLEDEIEEEENGSGDTKEQP